MSKPNVLIVDDHPVNRTLARVLLRGAGWTTEDACDGEEALQKLAGGGFGIVLLDISMPGISGEEVCRRIRADPVLKSLRVIAYTAHAMDDERERILAAGFDSLITKPITKAALLAVVEGGQGAGTPQ